jgi:hypothetical protein
MTSFSTIRDPLTDHLLTPQNAAPGDHRLPASSGKLDPIHGEAHSRRQHHRSREDREAPRSAHGHRHGERRRRTQPAHHPPDRGGFPDIVPIDRTSINTWEDEDFAAAVSATGRNKLIMTALWS